MMKKAISAFFLFSVLSSASASASSYNIKTHCYVPDGKTAIAIAEAVFIPIYGKEFVERTKPLHAKLDRNIWLVTNTPPVGVGTKGGYIVIKIRQKDGRIILVDHEE